MVLGANVRMSHLDNEMDDHEMELDADDTTAVVSHEFSLAAAGLDNVAIVSPYRVNTGYRRPAGGDSDHGYSTMTPHEDSEHAVSFVEPLLIGRDRYRPGMRSASVGSFSSRASSPPLRSNYRIESPATLHESADELEAEGRRKQQQPVNCPSTAAQQPFDGFSDSLAMTILPDSPVNQIIVPVTVHMVDTA